MPPWQAGWPPISAGRLLRPAARLDPLDHLGAAPGERPHLIGAAADLGDVGSRADGEGPPAALELGHAGGDLVPGDVVRAGEFVPLVDDRDEDVALGQVHERGHDDLGVLGQHGGGAGTTVRRGVGLVRVIAVERHCGSSSSPQPRSSWSMSCRAASATEPDNAGYTPIVPARSFTVRPRWTASVNAKISSDAFGATTTPPITTPVAGRQ